MQNLNLRQTISLFKIRAENEIHELLSYAREEIEMHKRLCEQENDKSPGWNYERAIRLQGKADGIRNAITMLDTITGIIPSKDDDFF